MRLPVRVMIYVIVMKTYLKKYTRAWLVLVGGRFSTVYFFTGCSIYQGDTYARPRILNKWSAPQTVT